MIGNLIGAVRLLLNSDQSNKQKKQILKNVVSSPRYQKLCHSLNVSGENFARRLLIWALRNRKYTLMRLLFKVKYKR